MRRRVLRAALASFALAAAFVVVLHVTPIDQPASRMQAPGTVVLAADGTALQRDTSDGIRIPVALDEVAPAVIAATIAAEDQRFRDHPGVDPIAIVRAMLNPGSGSGASTITQQLARRLYLGEEPGPLPVRKLREALVAMHMDAKLSKDDVLAAYLNDVPYGRATYGIEAAARVYFGVAAADLDLARAAFLAGLPRQPSLGSEEHFEQARVRQRYVLYRLVDDGKITAEAADAAFATTIHVLPEVAPPLAPHFVTYALAELAQERPDLAGRRDLIIETTLDAGLQYEAERIATNRLAELPSLSGASAAVVVLEPGSGRILAMVGNATAIGPGGDINMSTAPRQPGSALKPFLYALALEEGMTAATQVLDVPATFSDGAETYAPINYDRHFRGPVSLRVALASSLNVPAVRVLDEIGVRAFLGVAQRFGLGTLRDAEAYGHSIVLGGGDVRLLDLTGAYGVLAAGGMRTESYAVQRVRDGSGKVLFERPAAAPASVVTPQVAWLIGDILRDPDARAPGFGYGTALDAGVPASVKTGTTTEFRDNWTVGYTADRVVGVWVGHEDNQPMAGVSGVTGAAPIWRDIIESASAGTSVSVPLVPAGLVRAAVCSPTGLLPGTACPSPGSEWFLAGTEPTAVESYYVRDSSGALLVNPPAEARAWAIDAGLRVAPGRVGGSSGASNIVIHQPSDGAIVYLAPETGANDLLIRATSGDSATVTFTIDGLPAGEFASGVPFLWKMTPGQHTLEAAGGPGPPARVTFEVKSR